jgi:hypothetical protein
MLANTKRTYRLADYTVEHRAKGWFFTKTARFNDKEEWRGPYCSETSVSLMIARQLRREIVKRDAVHQLPE